MARRGRWTKRQKVMHITPWYKESAHFPNVKINCKIMAMNLVLFLEKNEEMNRSERRNLRMFMITLTAFL